VHEGGFSIERDYQNHWYFKRPDGRAVPACGYHAGPISTDDPLLAIPLAAAYLFAAVATFVVLLEICARRVEVLRRRGFLLSKRN